MEKLYEWKVVDNYDKVYCSILAETREEAETRFQNWRKSSGRKRRLKLSDERVWVGLTVRELREKIMGYNRILHRLGQGTSYLWPSRTERSRLQQMLDIWMTRIREYRKLSTQGNEDEVI